MRFGGTQTGDEGCLSIPGWIGEVTRYDRVTVRAQNLDGKEFRVKATDYLARVLQHEIDHLDGILFTDRMADPTALQRVETPVTDAARPSAARRCRYPTDAAERRALGLAPGAQGRQAPARSRRLAGTGAASRGSTLRVQRHGKHAADATACRTDRAGARGVAPAVGHCRHLDRPPSADPEWSDGVRQGSHPGDRYIRVARHTPQSNLPSAVEVTAREAEPRVWIGRSHRRLKRVIGEPLHDRAGVSQAPDEDQGAGGPLVGRLLFGRLRDRGDHAGAAPGRRRCVSVSMPIGAAIVILLLIVGFSYRQTIKAYPGGGGSYIVAKDTSARCPVSLPPDRC